MVAENAAVLGQMLGQKENRVLELTSEGMLYHSYLIVYPIMVLSFVLLN